MFFSLIKKDHKYIDTIINNAAFVGDNKKGWSVKFEKQSIDTWRDCFEVFNICF